MIDLRIPVMALLLLATGSAGAELSRAPSPEETIRRQVSLVIHERHPTDTPEWWRGLGPDAPPVLMAMYGETRNTHERTRLLLGLGWFGEDPAAVEFVKRETLKTDNKALRRAGVRSVGAAGRPEDTGFLAGFLEDADPDMRLAAAVALSARKGDESAEGALERFRENEKSPRLLERLDTRLRDAEAVRARMPRRGAAESVRAEDFAGTWKGYWIAPAGEGPGQLGRDRIAIVRSAPRADGLRKPDVKGHVPSSSERTATDTSSGR